MEMRSRPSDPSSNATSMRQAQQDITISIQLGLMMRSPELGPSGGRAVAANALFRGASTEVSFRMAEIVWQAAGKVLVSVLAWDCLLKAS